MIMVKILDCFHCNIIFVMLCNEIGWHNLQIRQVSGNFADRAVQFANWLTNVPFGRLADWTEHERVLQTVSTAPTYRSSRTGFWMMPAYSAARTLVHGSTSQHDSAVR